MDLEQGTCPPRPIPVVNAAAPELPLRCQICLHLLVVSVLLLLASGGVWLIVEGMTYKEPNYSVAITAVSGLNPATDIGRRPTLDSEFNLTIVVAPRSPLNPACAFPGTTLRVSYHGLELASTAVPKFCDERGTRTVVARGRVWLSGPALESLAADMRRATAAFDVTITAPHTEGPRSDGVHVLVVSCTGRRVGDGEAMCDVRKVEHARSTTY